MTQAGLTAAACTVFLVWVSAGISDVADTFAGAASRFLFEGCALALACGLVVFGRRRAGTVSCDSRGGLIRSGVVIAACMALHVYVLWIGSKGPGSTCGLFAALTGVSMIAVGCALARVWEIAQAHVEARASEYGVGAGVLAAVAFHTVDVHAILPTWISVCLPLACWCFCAALVMAGTADDTRTDECCPPVPLGDSSLRASSARATGWILRPGIICSLAAFGVYWGLNERIGAGAQNVGVVTAATLATSFACVELFRRASLRIGFDGALSWAIPCIAVCLALGRIPSRFASGLSGCVLVAVFALVAFAALVGGRDKDRFGTCDGIAAVGAFIVGTVSVKIVYPYVYASNDAVQLVELLGVALMCVASALFTVAERAGRLRAERANGGGAADDASGEQDSDSNAGGGLGGNIQSGVDEVARRYGLTPREAEVLALLARGYTQPAVRDRLGIALGTVDSHAKRIYAKLGVHSRDELIELCGQASEWERPNRGL